MRYVLFAVLAFIALSLPARADWPIDKMNEQIEKTNVIVSGICSGTVIDVKERLVLTANHCVTQNVREVEKREVDPKTGEIKVRLVQETQPMYVEVWIRKDYQIIATARHFAEIKGFDRASDTALLQVTDPSWIPEMAAPLASSSYKYKRGLPVFAVGNPGIEFDSSITSGIISAPQRQYDFGTGFKIPLFQHSASVIGGSSGGAIYNDSGEIIGTLTGGMRGANIALAVPISFAKEMIRKAGFASVVDKK